MIVYVKRPQEMRDSFLADHPLGEDTVRGYIETRHRCDELEECSGFTCQPGFRKNALK